MKASTVAGENREVDRDPAHCAGWSPTPRIADGERQRLRREAGHENCGEHQNCGDGAGAQTVRARPRWDLPRGHGGLLAWRDGGEAASRDFQCGPAPMPTRLQPWINYLY